MGDKACLIFKRIIGISKLKLMPYLKLTILLFLIQNFIVTVSGVILKKFVPFDRVGILKWASAIGSLLLIN